MIRTRPILASLVLAALAATPIASFRLSAQQSTDRAHVVGKRVKCMCGGCSDTAATCYHTGGAFSGPCDTAKGMLKEIKQRMGRGESDDLILQSFVQEYGTTVYVEPPHQGFGKVAWWTPVLAFVFGLSLVALVISRWRKHAAQHVAAAGSAPGISPELLERARAQASRETQD